MNKRKAILYIACSLDGFIAKPNDDLSFLSIVEKEGEDYGYFAFEESIDTIIMGRKTYDWLMTQVDEFPHLNKKTYVITRSERQSDHPNLIFYNGDLVQLVEKLRENEGKPIFIDGGAQIVSTLLNASLIDELIISIIPVLLGDGTRLFPGGTGEHQLKLVNSKSYSSGLVQVHYSKDIVK